MNQETVIHGRDGSLGLCGTQDPETTTANRALMTCPGCVHKAREQIMERVRTIRAYLDAAGRKLAELDHEDELPVALAAALVELDHELATLKFRLEIDATALAAADGISDA